ncbi:MAG TPA: hypothetical protein VNO81_06035, partial [Candidatus Nitrosotenuis sp.]|nr:hypothetical protein [Candidatus Nitrosotenuis sp.]
VVDRGSRSGEPDWRKFVVYYLDDQGRLRRHEIRPPETFKKMCLKGTTRILQDPFEFLQDSRQDVVIARGLVTFQILPMGSPSFLPVPAPSFSPTPSYTPLPSGTDWVFQPTRSVRILLELKRSYASGPVSSRLEGAAEVIYDGP